MSTPASHDPEASASSDLVPPDAISDYLPDEPVLTSSWDGMRAQVHRGHHFPERGRVPALSDHVMYLHLKTPTELRRWLRGEELEQGVIDEGSLTVVPAQTPSDWQWKEPVHVLHLYLKPSLIRRVALQSADVDPDTVELVPRFNASDPLVNQIGQALITEMKDGGTGSDLYVQQASEMLAAHLLRHHTRRAVDPETHTGGIPPARLQRVRDYVESHLDADVRLDDLAEKAEMSPYHFSRQFKKTVGRSPSQYVIDRRIEKARHLLEEKSWLIGRVALEVGYESQSRFTKQFKRRVGRTPGAYRDAQG